MVDERYRILVGDCIESMRSLPDQSVNCCVTSPPYWGLRDYGHDGQIGLEETPAAYVARMVEVFREVRRVLRDDGTCWVNLGDSYSAGGRGVVTNGPQQSRNGRGVCGPRDKHPSAARAALSSFKDFGDLKQKDLVGIPWRVAFALQADGWYLRQDIIWHKPNPMPESVRDRCTKAHEYVFLLSKSARYWYDADAVRVEGVCRPQVRDRASNFGKTGLAAAVSGGRAGSDADNQGREGVVILDGKRNKRSVWTVTTKPYSGAHFAVFPPKLIEPCILAGCPVGGTVLDPFGGSGTTACVALNHQRRAILCELNPDYVELAHKRIAGSTAQTSIFDVLQAQGASNGER